MTQPDNAKIAIVDFSSFLDSSNKQSVADAMLESFKEIGFVYLVNHGLPKDKIQTMFDWSKKFFAQPMEIKQLAPHPPSGTHHRGYSAPGVEKVSQHIYDEKELAAHRAKAPDVKESFEVGREEDSMQPNIWLPDDVLPGFKEACLDFFWVCDKIKFRVLSAIALGLHLPEDFFDRFHQEPDNQLRLLHYPSVPVSALATNSIARIGAHSDFDSITLLLQDDVGGLEVEDPNEPGVFRAVPPIKDALIVNAGDLMMRWSNDVVRSTIHRVQAPQGLVSSDGMTPERYSIPYFCSTASPSHFLNNRRLRIAGQDFDTVIECLPGTFDAHRPKRYEPISATEYVMKRLAANY